MTVLDTLVQRYKSTGTPRVYKANQVPSSPAYPYAVMSLDIGLGRTRRAGGPTSRKSWQITVEISARTPDAADDLAAKADEAFEDKVLSELPDNPYSIRGVRSSSYRDPDDNGVWRVVLTYTFG